MTAPVIPQTSEELAEFIVDRKKMSEVFNNEDPTILPQFLTNYAKAVNKADPSIEKQLDDRIEQALASFARDNHVTVRKGDKGDAPVTALDIKRARQSGTLYNDKAPGVELNGKWGKFTDFLQVIDTKTDPRESTVAEQRLMIKNAMSSTDPASGGFLIPEEFRATMLEVALETAIVRPRASVIPMAALRIAMPMLDVTSNVANVFGGIVAYWTEEAAALTQSQPTFGQIVLEAKKLTAYTEVPNELVQDSAISVEAFIATRFPAAVAYFEDVAFLQGTGVGEPLGALNALNSALVTVAIEAGQGTSTILWENIVKMYSRMLPQSLARAVWLVPPDAFSELATMALSVGTGGSAIWLNNGVEGPPMTILGRPVIVTEKVNRLGQANDVNFVDFDQYLIGDRMAMSAVSSTDFRFGTDTTAYRLIERVDGRPWIQSAITPRNSGPTLSPFVSLAARP